MEFQRKPSTLSSKTKVQFLTEKDSACEGEFTKRRRELLEAKSLSHLFKGDVSKSLSAPAFSMPTTVKPSEHQLYSLIIII